jgi:hypothetical protein
MRDSAGVVQTVVRRAGTVARAVRAGRARSKSSSFEATQIDGSALCALLGTVADDVQLVHVPASRRRWTPSSIRVEAGDHITWLAWGTAYVIRPLAVGVRPRFALAGRVGRGPVQQSGDDGFTFTSDRDGRVELASLFPGELQPDGSIGQDRIPYFAMTRGFDAVVTRWPRPADPGTALDRIAAQDPSGLCAAEARRLADPPLPPPGWSHHPLLRPAPTYVRTEDGVATHVRDAVGIIRHPLDVALTPSLRLRWSWRMDQLPSTLPEDTTLTHDYLSVATEFDDGHDLTWHWSSGLSPGYAYRCPFDHWRRRETHIVVRSGQANLGRWVDEERLVLADHQTAIGGPAPRRVVAVWLISCSFLQGREGRGEFAGIELADGSNTVRVL